MNKSEKRKQRYLKNKDRITEHNRRHNKINNKLVSEKSRQIIKETLDEIINKFGVDTKKAKMLLQDHTLSEILQAESLDNIQDLVKIDYRNIEYSC